MSNVLVISDIDGVLADNTHRLPLMYRKDWDSFYSKEMIREDKLIEAGRLLLHRLAKDEAVVFVTGRRESCRMATKEWLSEHCCSDYDAMFMRPEGDFRAAPKLKVDLIRRYLEVCEAREIKFDYIYFIDDSPENVEAVVTKVKYGDTPVTGIVYGVSRMTPNINIMCDPIGKDEKNG